MATHLGPSPMGPRLGDGRGWNTGDPAIVRRRAWLCGGFLTLAFCGLVARLWFLQVVKGAEYLVQAQGNQTRRVPLSAPRGLILDRNNQVLVTSRALHSVAVVPAALPSSKQDPEARARILNTVAFLLHTTGPEIEAQLLEARKRGGHSYDPVRIAEDVDLPTITLIEENQLRFGSDGQTAVLVTNDLARTYPNGKLAGHVLGYTGVVTESDMDKAQTARDENPDASVRDLKFDDTIGKSGVEREYDTQLSGERGSEEYEVDSQLRPVRKRGIVPEVPGQTLVLTLDARLQRAAENALDKARNSGAAVAIDPRNGEVLAIASRPGFDPNLFSLPRRAFQKAYLQLVRDKKHPLINRAVTSRFPPGSTFKMITASAGLQRGTIDPDATHVCNGGIRMGRWFGCWAHHGAGINLDRAFAKSCDVYFYEEAMRLGNPESSGPTYLAETARKFGLGVKTGIDLPIDGAGLIPDPAWRRERNAGNADLARWYPGNTLNMSIGQGDVLATPLQMALATSAVANGGTLWKPHLLKGVRESNGQLRASRPEGHAVGIERRYLNLVRHGMREVIVSGTARGPFKDMTQVEVAGKTGSAEDDANGTAHAWFVCFAPYKNPTIAIAVIVENSGHGSENAAPVAKKILEAAFPAPVETPSPRLAAR